jgi:uncharacterized membrane protein HdeD (DUF308 family)
MQKIKSSRLLVLAGIIFVLTGIFCLLTPLRAYVNLVRFSGIVLLINGILLQMASSYAHMSFAREKISMRIESIVDFIFGILLIFNPFLTFILFPLLIGCWILFKGVIKIIVSLLLRKQIGGWRFIFAVGILAVVFAWMIIFAPLTRANDITKIIGAFFICLGSVLIYDSIKLRRMHETVNLLF